MPGLQFNPKTQAMRTEQEFYDAIDSLELKHRASVGREAYLIGEQLRQLRREVQDEYPVMGDLDENGDCI